MDTSGTHIKMRLRAIPDLGMGIPPAAFGSWIADYVFVDIKGDFYYSTEREVCQLERQDQLQEMVSKYIKKELGEDRIEEMWGTENSEIKQAFLDFAHWLGIQYHDEPFTCVPTNCFETGDQLWLAFVMKELYNKSWNEKDWVVCA